MRINIDFRETALIITSIGMCIKSEEYKLQDMNNNPKFYGDNVNFKINELNNDIVELRALYNRLLNEYYPEEKK